MTVPVFELLLTSSILILALIAVRYALRGRISPRLQYALWALVLVRLLLPVSLPSPLSVMNAAEPAAQHVALYLYDTTNAVSISQETDGGGSTAPTGSTAPAAAVSGGESAVSPAPQMRHAWDTAAVLWAVWAAGASLAGAWFLWTNFRFARMLRRTRKPFDASAYGVSLPVYTVEKLPSPCLFGLFRPAVYIAPDCPSDPQKLRHILAHELTHHRQGDTLWSALRGLCLCLYWFDPLVWAAAVLSRRDCELSCDAGAIRCVGEDQRFDYGRTLLSLMVQRATPVNLLCAATTMSGGARSRRERIALIAKRPHMKISTAALALLLALLCAACTLTGQTATSNGVELYTSDGMTLALPKEYAGKVLVNPDGVSLPADTLFQVYEKDTFSEQGEGWLFSLCTTDELGYERFQADPHAGIFFLAYGGDAYYYLQFLTSATDETEDTAEDSLTALLGDYDAIMEDFAERNGLAVVSPFLYSVLYRGETASMLYAPNGPDDPARWEIFLVQPCTSGESGIWAVYQWKVYDGSGQGVYYPIFPDGIPSRSYYAQQQLAADQGHQPGLLDPQQVAFTFIEAQGADADMDNVIRFTLDNNSSIDSTNVNGNMNWTNNVIAEATAQAKEVLRQRIDITDEQLKQVEYVRAGQVCASYNGLLDAGVVDGVHQYYTITASQVWLTLPDDLTVPEGTLTVQRQGDGRIVGIGCFLTTGTDDPGEQNVYLGFIDGGSNAQQSAPSFTEVLNLLLANESPELLGNAGEAVLCTRGETTIAIPAQYSAQVVVQTEDPDNPDCLFTFYEKTAYDADEEDKNSDQGFLFSIRQYSIEDYNAYLQSDPLDTVFAADNKHFYTVLPGGEADWGENSLMAMILRAFICADMVERNDLEFVENGIMPWMSVPAP